MRNKHSSQPEDQKYRTPSAATQKIRESTSTDHSELPHRKYTSNRGGEVSRYRNLQHTTIAGRTNQKLEKPVTAQPAHTTGSKKIRFVTWSRKSRE